VIKSSNRPTPYRRRFIAVLRLKRRWSANAPSAAKLKVPGSGIDWLEN
jgi:hypothetical protein